VESKPFGIYKILRITVKSSGKKGFSVPVRLRRGVEKLRLERILFYIIGNFIPILWKYYAVRALPILLVLNGDGGVHFTLTIKSISEILLFSSKM